MGRTTAKPPTRNLWLGALQEDVLFLDGQDTKSHMHVMGKSGSGKSRWLAGFYVNLLKAGFSATLIDPHGDLARLVLAQLAAEGYFDQEDAYERLLYLDIPTAAKANRYLNFNCLKQPYDRVPDALDLRGHAAGLSRAGSQCRECGTGL